MSRSKQTNELSIERPGTGFVRRGELYTLQSLKVRLGLKDAALRSARRAGLAVRYFGGRGYVLGDDVIAFVTNEKSRSAE